MTETAIRVDRQGDPVANHASVRIRHDDAVLIEMDMATKHLECYCDGLDEAGTPFVELLTTEGTPGIGATANFTRLAFPEFPGLAPAIVEAGRYSVRILLAKPRDEDGSRDAAPPEDAAVLRVAKAINGPHVPVPEGSPRTLEELREVRWGMLSRMEQAARLNEARSAILALCAA
jgi:hypothetical protein